MKIEANELRSALNAISNKARVALENQPEDEAKVQKPLLKAIKEIAEIAGAFILMAAVAIMFGLSIIAPEQRNAEAELIAHEMGE